MKSLVLLVLVLGAVSACTTEATFNAEDCGGPRGFYLPFEAGSAFRVVRSCK